MCGMKSDRVKSNCSKLHRPEGLLTLINTLPPTCTPAGDDLALSLRAARWLAPRFLALSSAATSSTADGAEGEIGKRALDTNAGAVDKKGAAAATKASGAAENDMEDSNPFLPTAASVPSSPHSGSAGALGGGDGHDEPLQLLLELAAGRLGAGADGLHNSLSLIGGAFRGLTSMRLRRAFAAALRAHLQTVQVDAVFRFDSPRQVDDGSSGHDPAAGGGAGISPPARLALPPMSNWGSFRKYTVTMWVRPDPVQGGGGHPVTLFRLRTGEGVGVEAVLTAPAAPATPTVSGATAITEKEIVVTSFLKGSSSSSAQKSFSARCKFGGPKLAAETTADTDGGSVTGDEAAAAAAGGGVAEGARMGGWRFVVVSHGQPLVKRAGKLRVSVDGEVMLETELQYPAGTGQAARDAMSK